MVRRKISRDIKERALFLLDHPDLCNDVCAVLGVSRRSVERWQENYERYGDVEGQPMIRTTRRRRLNNDQIIEMTNLLYSNPSLLLEEIQQWVQVTKNVLISCSAISRYIKDAGLTYKRLKMRAAERDEEEAEAWMIGANNEFVAEQLVSVDETSKDGRTMWRRYGYAPVGQDAIQYAPFPRGERWSLCPAMTINGYIAQLAVPGSVRTADFTRFIIERVVCDFFLVVHFLSPCSIAAPSNEPMARLSQCSAHGQLCYS